jgi:hypothetical protein
VAAQEYLSSADGFRAHVLHELASDQELCGGRRVRFEIEIRPRER